MEILLLAIPFCALFALSAFFSSSETVLFSLTPLQLRTLTEKKPVLGRRISAWLKEPSRVLSTILAGNTLTNFAIASLGYRMLVRVAPSAASAISIPAVTFLLLVFGEIFPKQYAMRHAEALAPSCARMLTVFTFILTPVSFLMAMGRRVFGDILSRERRALSDDELRSIVDSAAASGVLDKEEASMVNGVMRLPDLYAMNEMTPRVRLAGVPKGLSPEETARRAREAKHSFVPVYAGDMDHIEGFLNVRQLLADPSLDVAAATEKPLRVREHQRLDAILVIFMKSGRRIALVTDRWGGTAGVITRGDILELIVQPVLQEEA